MATGVGRRQRADRFDNLFFSGMAVLTYLRLNSFSVLSSWQRSPQSARRCRERNSKGDLWACSNVPQKSPIRIQATCKPDTARASCLPKSL